MTLAPGSSGPLLFGDRGFSCLYSGVAGFADIAGLGAALRAFAILHFGFTALALPAALVALLAVRCPGTAAI